MSKASSFALAGLHLLILSSFATSCASGNMDNVLSVSGPIIYDRDDREELVQSKYRHLGDPAIALIPHNTFGALASFSSEDRSTMEASWNWCPDERFVDQPHAAVCGGVAIAPQYVLTASHCVPDQPACEGLAFVRGYAVDEAGHLATDQLEAYDCDNVVLSATSDLLEPEAFDFAIVHLRTPISDFPSVAPRVGAVFEGETGVCISPSSGLPLKVSTGAIVDVNRNHGFFHVAVDLFAGGSGSGVFDERGDLLGIAVAGSQDYEETPEGCLRARIVDTEDGSSAELGNTFGAIDEYACARNPRLPFCVEGGQALHASGGCQVSPVPSRASRSAYVIIALALLSVSVRRAAGRKRKWFAKHLGAMEACRSASDIC